MEEVLTFAPNGTQIFFTYFTRCSFGEWAPSFRMFYSEAAAYAAIAKTTTTGVMYDVRLWK